MDYPQLVGFHFSVQVQLDGNAIFENRFQEVSGISMSLETESIKEGGENRFSFQLPTRATYSDLVLTRAMEVNSELVTWCLDAILNMDIKPALVLVSLLNEEHAPLKTFAFVNAYPKKWEVRNLNAEQSQLAIESITLAYQYYTIL